MEVRLGAALGRRHLPAVETELAVGRRPGRQMPRKSHDGEVPADTHRAWAELAPVILDDRCVLHHHSPLATVCR